MEFLLSAISSLEFFTWELDWLYYWVIPVFLHFFLSWPVFSASLYLAWSLVLLAQNQAVSYRLTLSSLYGAKCGQDASCHPRVCMAAWHMVTGSDERRA